MSAAAGRTSNLPMQSNEARRATLIAFLTGLVTLSAQILTTRIVSAKLLNNYAFFVISLSMPARRSFIHLETWSREYDSTVST